MLNPNSLLVLFATLLVPGPDTADSLLTLCNRTGEKLWAASLRAVYRGFQEEDRVWIAEGWWEVGNARCTNVTRVRRFGWEAFTFTRVVDGQRENPVFPVSGGVERPVGATHFCVTYDGFESLPVSNEKIGLDCPEGFTPSPISFFVLGGDNNVRLTLR